MVHTNSNSAKREKEAVTFAIRVRTMWYGEKVSNFEISFFWYILIPIVQKGRLIPIAQKGRKSVTFALVSTYNMELL